MVYTVTFNPAIDYVVHTGEMKLGATNRSEREEMYFGGKGINVSIVLRELGIDSKALGFTAGFTGEAIEKGLYSLLIEALINVTFLKSDRIVWSVYPLICCSVIGMGLIVIAICPSLRRNLEKKFFV